MTLVRELVRVAPHAGAHRPALRCAVSVGVPMLVLLALDRVDLLGAAAFGAFTAIYGRDLTAPARTAVQALTGGLLTVSVGVGLLAAHLPGAPWLESAVLVALAGAATVLGGMVDWKPGGPLFLVFAAGAFAGAPAQSAGGAAAVLATTAGTAVFSVLVGSAGAVFPSHVRTGRPLLLHRARDQRGDLVEVVLACALAATVGVLLGVEHLYWALIGAVVPLSVARPTHRLARGLHRVAGTLVGLVLAWPLLAAGLPAWAVVLTAVVLQTGAELLVLRNYGLALLCITPLALVVSATMHPAATDVLLADRLLATVVGVGSALAVGAARRTTLRGRRALDDRDRDDQAEGQVDGGDDPGLGVELVGRQDRADLDAGHPLQQPHTADLRDDADQAEDQRGQQALGEQAGRGPDRGDHDERHRDHPGGGHDHRTRLPVAHQAVQRARRGDVDRPEPEQHEQRTQQGVEQDRADPAAECGEVGGVQGESHRKVSY